MHNLFNNDIPRRLVPGYGKTKIRIMFRPNLVTYKFLSLTQLFTRNHNCKIQKQYLHFLGGNQVLSLLNLKVMTRLTRVRMNIHL